MTDYEKMEALKKTKTSTLITAILTLINSIFSVIGAVSLIPLKNLDVSQLPLEQAQIIEASQALLTPTMIAMSFGFTILIVVLTIVFFMWNSKLKKGIVVSKIPYYLFILFCVYSIVSSIIQGGFSLFNLVVNGLLMVCPVIALVNLFKLEEE